MINVDTLNNEIKKFGNIKKHDNLYINSFGTLTFLGFMENNISLILKTEIKNEENFKIKVNFKEFLDTLKVFESLDITLTIESGKLWFKSTNTMKTSLECEIVNVEIETKKNLGDSSFTLTVKEMKEIKKFGTGILNKKQPSLNCYYFIQDYVYITDGSIFRKIKMENNIGETPTLIPADILELALKFNEEVTFTTSSDNFYFIANIGENQISSNDVFKQPKIVINVLDDVLEQKNEGSDNNFIVNLKEVDSYLKRIKKLKSINRKTVDLSFKDNQMIVYYGDYETGKEIEQSFEVTGENINGKEACFDYKQLNEAILRIEQDSEIQLFGWSLSKVNSLYIKSKKVETCLLGFKKE